MRAILRDLGFAFRVLRKRPGFAAVAIATLSLGIGANTAIFSLVHGMLLSSVAFPEPDRLVFMGEASEQIPNMSVSYPNFLDWRERNRSFVAIAAHNYATFNLTGLEVPEVLTAVRTSASLLSILRVEPMLGRSFTEEDDHLGAEKIVLVSHEFWQTRLGADPDVVGRTLTLDSEPYEMVGVMPPGFLYPITNFAVDLWMPIEPFAREWMEERGNHPGIYVTGRLREGVSLEQARADMESVARALAEEYPDTNTGNGVAFAPLTERVVANIKPALLVLSGAVALVLLIACANVANLLLARGLARRREIAVRSALGSGKWQLVRQLLTESVLLAVFAGALGIGVAAAALALLKSRIDPSLLRGYGEVGLDLPVLGFTMAISVVTGMAFGLVPALQLLKTNVTGNLKEGGRGSSSGHRGLRGSLVVSEIALALVLLVGAVLLVQSFRNLAGTDPGFDDRNVLTMTINLPDASYPEEGQQALFFEELLLRIRSLPGVISAATTLPLLGGWQNGFIAEGQPPPQPGEEVSVDVTRVSPGYFETMGVKLLRGRLFDETDRADSRPVAIVDRTFAEAFWPGEDPMGKRVKAGTDPGSENPWMEVVGVVEHVKNYGVAQPSRVEIYLPSEQSQLRFATLLVKTGGDPRSLVQPVQREVLAIDPDQAVSRVRTLEEITALTTAPQRLSASFLSAFSGLALVLAAIGIYGVMAYSVAERRQEMGIRMALGASSGSVSGLVVREGFKLTVVGIALGFLLAFFGAPLLSSVLFGLSPRDPFAFGILPLVLALISLAACGIPALRASRVSPVTVLRCE